MKQFLTLNDHLPKTTLLLTTVRIRESYNRSNLVPRVSLSRSKWREGERPWEQDCNHSTALAILKVFFNRKTNTTKLTTLMPDLLYDNMITQKKITMKFYCSTNYSSLFSHNLKFSFFHIFKRVLARSFSSFRLKVWLIERKAALKWVCVIARTSTKWPGKALLFCFLRLFWKFFMQVTITLFFSFCRTIFGWHFRIVCFASAEVTNAWIGVSQDASNGKRIVSL